MTFSHSMKPEKRQQPESAMKDAPAKIAYFFSTFPHLNTTFLQREVRGLRQAGLYPLLAANRPPKPGAYHPQDQDLLAETCYLNPIRPGLYLRANTKWLIKHPRRYLHTVWLALRLKNGFRRQRIRNLARLAGAAVLAEHLKANDVSHVHVHFAFGAAGLAILLEALSGIPYSLSIHGSDVLLSQPLTEEKLSRARFVISNCRYHIPYLLKQFPDLGRQRFFTVPLGLSLTHAPWGGMSPVAPVPPLRILNVARFDPIKGHGMLIQCCARLKAMGVPFVCRLVGDGPTRQEISEQIRNLALTDVVEVKGPLFESEVAKQFDWCHVMVLSSLSEGTPMTVIEAMAKGRAVVAPEITGLPEMMVEGETGLMYPRGSYVEMAACLARLFNQPGLIEQMGVAGRRRAERLYDIKLNSALRVDILRANITQTKERQGNGPDSLRHHHTCS